MPRLSKEQREQKQQLMLRNILDGTPGRGLSRNEVYYANNRCNFERIRANIGELNRWIAYKRQRHMPEWEEYTRFGVPAPNMKTITLNYINEQISQYRNYFGEMGLPRYCFYVRTNSVTSLEVNVAEDWHTLRELTLGWMEGLARLNPATGERSNKDCNSNATNRTIIKDMVDTCQYIDKFMRHFSGNWASLYEHVYRPKADGSIYIPPQKECRNSVMYAYAGRALEFMKQSNYKEILANHDPRYLEWLEMEYMDMLDQQPSKPGPKIMDLDDSRITPAERKEIVRKIDAYLDASYIVIMNSTGIDIAKTSDPHMHISRVYKRRHENQSTSPNSSPEKKQKTYEEAPETSL